jgi:subtilase family protein
MIDRESFYRIFYGEAPPPPPWATECPVKFEVWLAFASQVRMVGIRDAAVALGTTQQELRKRQQDEFPGARKVGNTWQFPLAELRKHAAHLPDDIATWSDLKDHPRVDVILAVNEEFRPSWLLQQLKSNSTPPRLSSSANPIAAGSYIVVLITFAELIQSIIPHTNLARKIRSAQSLGPEGLRQALRGQRFDLLPTSEENSPPSATAEQRQWETNQLQARHGERVDHLGWFLNVLAAVAGSDEESIEDLANLIQAAPSQPSAELPEMIPTKVIDRRRRHPILTANLNREAKPSVSRSRVTIKADAAEQLFTVDTSTLTWAVVDSGIDARHPAFALRDDTGAVVPIRGGASRTRVVRTFNLVGARRALARDAPDGLVDWTVAIPRVELLPPDPIPGSSPDQWNQPWTSPGGPHGTHVAGILAADWPENGLRGICPALRLHDVRVLDAEGRGDEFSIVTALQLIRHINEQAGRLVIVGVNLSLSVPHDVANYSTGWTPVCIECDRLWRSGVVVVASAGNAGFEGGSTTLGFGYNAVSISDPGNTDSIITVGSTHRSDPHRHGVSYFSSRGPTADGRLKPDLLAPGEDIDGPVPDGGLHALHGTSQAAAHVSGVAAMLMARYRELIGRPERIKEILCHTATDLGREKAFQGHGLVDALRAMQAI